MYKLINEERMTYIIGKIKELFVQKQTGKGLSANDFTNILKQKLDGIETGAQVNTVDSVNGEQGVIVITSDDIEFLSSVVGATPTTVRAIIDDIIANDTAQDTEIGKKANTTYVDSQLSDKVDKVDGKGLSTQDFTTVLRDKLNAIEAGAQVNTVDSVNNKTGNIVITSDDIEFLSSVSGATPTTIRAIIDEVIANDIAQDTEIAKKANTTYVDSQLSDKVNKVTGKGLSANDFTSILKQKLEGMETGAQVNTVDSVNSKTGDVVITSDDIEFLSSVAGATPTTIRAIIDDVITNDIAQDTEIGKKANTTYVDSQLGDKVDKVTGKGLSTQDFTTTLRDKLNAIEAGAETNIIEVIKRNGTNLVVTDKEVDISVPTKFSELTNDINFKTETEIQAMIHDLGKLKKEVVSALPDISEADTNTLYLLPSDSGGFSEWFAIDGVWEKMGDTAEIDLTGYVKHSDITFVTETEIDAMFSA